MKSIPILAVITLLSAPPAIHADTAGDGGHVLAAELVSDGSDQFGLLRGRVLIRQRVDEQTVEYVWGGNICPGRDLADWQVQILFDLAATPYMLVVPQYRNGQGGSRCLVRWTAFNEKYD